MNIVKMDFSDKVVLLEQRAQETLTSMLVVERQQFIPQIVIVTKDNTIGIGVIPDIPNMRPLEVAKFLLRTLKSEDIDLVVIHFDSYMACIGQQDDGFDQFMRDLSVRKLENLFKDGNPHVYEALITVAFDREESVLVQRPYRYSVQDGLEWSDIDDRKRIDLTQGCADMTWQNVFGGIL
jgi:hypothetical protein